jgi:TPP-dependent pyruvate/acetoin dehydrogenase alpha subunit
MLEIRYCEERIQELFLENVIRGTTHLCIGQEGVSVGMAAVVDAKRGDTVTCTYRGHGHALALGLSLHSMMAEMMGKEAGGTDNLITVICKGDVASVKAAVDAGSKAVGKVGELVASHVIARPHEDLGKIFFGDVNAVKK